MAYLSNRFTVLCALFLRVILIPFLLFEKTSNLEVEKLLNADTSRAAIAIVIIVVLALDVFLARPLERRRHRIARAARLLDRCHRLDVYRGCRVFPIGLMMKVH